MKSRYIRPLILAILGVFLACFLVSAVVIPAFHRRCKAPPMLPPSSGEGERIECIDDNDLALIRRLQVIGSARKELIFTTFSYVSDESGRDMMAALLDAADRGVRVRVLVDGMCVFTGLGRSREFQTLARSDNVEIRVYNPVSLLKPWRVNYRMHDKYIVADDAVYLLGGRNTKNVSLGKYQEKTDVDRDILVYRPSPSDDSSLSQLKGYFESVWSLPAARPYGGGQAPDPVLQEGLRSHYSRIQSGAPEILAVPDWNEITYPVAGIRLLTNPIGASNKEPVLWENLLQLMHQEQELVVQTPYIILNGKMYRDLQALTDSGHPLTVITNAPETGANATGCADYRNQRSRLLKMGLTLCEYAGTHSSHTKTVLMGDRLSAVGSFNFDMRSAYLDTEMMLLIDSPELNEHLRRICQQQTDESRILLPDGSTTEGHAYTPAEPGLLRQILQDIIRVLILPVRHLL